MTHVKSPQAKPPEGGTPAALVARFIAAIGFISSACGVLAAMMILASIVITCQMIFIRFVLGLSTIWQTEAVIYLMIGATLVGLPYVQKLRGHVNVDLVPLMLPEKPRRFLMTVILLVTIAITSVMFYYGFELWHVAWARGWSSESVWAIKLWIPYIAMPIGFGLFLLQLIADLLTEAFEIHEPNLSTGAH